MGSKIQIIHALRVLLFSAAFLGGLSLAQAQSQAPSSGKPSASADANANAQKDSSDKVDIKDLENQYWAPKDTDFTVVQNRAYTKEHRYALSAQFGPLLNDKYSDGDIGSLSGNYFFNERYGIQVDYQHAFLQNNDTVNYFINNYGGAPDYTRMKDYYGLGFSYIPIYAKMSLLNKKIIYFDFAITPIVGMTTYQQVMQHSEPTANALTYGFDVSQYFFFSDHFAIRTSIRDQWYNEQVLKYSSDNYGAEGSPKRNDTISSFELLLGITVFF